MKPDFIKLNGLLPVIIQDAASLEVLMLGYMNQEAFNKTCTEKRVTFYSRSRKMLWTKGETSGNYLTVASMGLDCDSDTLLIKAIPAGPTCHTGSYSCFGNQSNKGFLYKLEQKISDRIDSDADGSYTNALYKKGINKIAQKVGEEAVELIIEAKDNNQELFTNEAADLLYHYLVLLKAKGVSLQTIEGVMRSRV
ncbi:bifunctional phosphoribosyl-AMP cyclohydrolase/phosphoribosyl-ATP diphosphatase HisIE [Flavobacterium rhizosphaerae]|uniref:Histidine biosynthesis bifunctional protein HisIE n=1 Tax=Flavobacterium rhizosphaerae TaxID=3163298 RepID=A0ABW8YX08_9FLAO